VIVDKQNRIAVREPSLGPCIASPTHNSFGADASKRPNAGDDEDDRRFSPSRSK
jgi:hypothetical protein